MIPAVVLLLALTSAVSPYAKPGPAARSRCWSSGNGQAARWWNEGERVDRGKFWYECHRGQLQTMGCFSQSGKRLRIGESFDLGGYTARCTLSSDGYLEFSYSGCTGPDGTSYQKGEKFTDPTKTYVFECQPDGKLLKKKVIGCMSHDKTKQLELGEVYDYGDYSYKCSMNSNGSVQLCSVGCIYNGRRFKIGEQWPEDEYIFYCKSSGGRCQKRCIGCMDKGRSLYDGDRYRRDNTVYQCEIRPDSYGKKPVGCVAKDSNGGNVDRVVGCRWYQQTPNSKIEQTCKLVGERAIVETVGCIYRHNGFDTIFLNPGRYTVWTLPRQTNKAVGLACKKTTDGARLEIFNPDDLIEHTFGLQYDMPRGK